MKRIILAAMMVAVAACGGNASLSPVGPSSTSAGASISGTVTGSSVEYLLPHVTNIRRVFLDNSTSPPTFWTGNNQGAQIVKEIQAKHREDFDKLRDIKDMRERREKTRELTKKVNEETTKALSGVLEEKQTKRLEQVDRALLRRVVSVRRRDGRRAQRAGRSIAGR